MSVARNPCLVKYIDFRTGLLKIYYPDNRPFSSFVELDQLRQQAQQQAQQAQQQAQQAQQQAQQAQQQAQQAEQKVEKLAAKLRELGIDPNSL
ncbi:MAG: hypothetical protein LH474_04235 [Chamaesiphon sp.]|nr:hypothetical protein [Chamaesiphon sp.]